MDKHTVMYLKTPNIACLSVFAGEIPDTGGEAISSLDLCDHLCIGRDTQYCCTFSCSLEMFKDKEEAQVTSL